LLAAGHARAASLAQRDERGKEREQPLVGPGRPCGAGCLPADFQVLGHREIGEDAPVFRHVAHAEARHLVGMQLTQVAAVEHDFAGGSGHQSHDRLERGGLARAVAAEQGDDFTAVHFEVDVEEHARAAVAGAQAPDLKRRQGTPLEPVHRYAPLQARRRR
jgi:hypothetical protein